MTDYLVQNRVCLEDLSAGCGPDSLSVVGGHQHPKQFYGSGMFNGGPDPNINVMLSLNQIPFIKRQTDAHKFITAIFPSFDMCKVLSEKHVL